MSTKLKSTDFMLTFSPRESYTDDQEKAISDALVLGKHFMVREYGKKGDHPHLHVVIRYEKPTRSDVLRKSVLRMGILHGDDKELKVSVLKDTPEMLVAKYLNKDPNRVILYNSLVDLDNLPQIKEPIYGVLQGKRIITPAEATLLIIEYCYANDIPPPVRPHELYTLLVRMVHEDYVVHNVIRNKKDILTNIRLYVDDPEHPNMQWANEFAENT